LIDQVLFKTEVPTNSSAIIVLTFFTAFKTPFQKSLPPSRNSTASCSPVDAPDGAALPKTPLSVITSTSIVFPLESKICLA
jgi:hypothetical protein